MVSEARTGLNFSQVLEPEIAVGERRGTAPKCPKIGSEVQKNPGGA
jgi:hypothetical protein